MQSESKPDRQTGANVPFRIVRSEDYDAMSRAAAAHLTEQLRRKPDSLLVLATGASPEGTYRLLADAARRESSLCERVVLMKLDEWGGLSPEDPATCEGYLRRLLVEPLGIGPERFRGWRCRPDDIAAECRRIQELLERHGPADVCVLGLGLNGHLGFNEPAASLQPGPHWAELSPESLAHGMLRDAARPPGYGLTLGMRDILQSREVLLLVSGEKKRAQLRRLLQPEVTPQFPGSFLWLHPALTVYCDEAALP